MNKTKKQSFAGAAEILDSEKNWAGPEHQNESAKKAKQEC